MRIPWHRFFKVGLRQLFSGTKFEVHDEFDLSDQVQRVDFAIICKGDSDYPMPDPDHLPDGLQDLRDHNLISYKSMNEPLDRFAVIELVGHAVTYSKLQAAKADINWQDFVDQLGLFAVSTRKPSTEAMAKLLKHTEKEAVYEIDYADCKITCIVINRTEDRDRNWLWQLLKGDRSRWQKGRISAILKAVGQQLRIMGIQDPEIEAFETQVIESWLQEIDLTTTSEGQALIDKGIEKGIEKGIDKGEEQAELRIAERMIRAGKSDTEVAEMTSLSLPTVQAVRNRLEK